MCDFDPHATLGIHPSSAGGRIIRVRASHLDLCVQGKWHTPSGVGGIAEMEVAASTGPFDYLVRHRSGLVSHDPYVFSPTWGELDSYLLSRGVHYRLFDALGAHLMEHQGVRGVRFAVWAPAAKAVSLVGDFTHFDLNANPMRSMGCSGVWELFVPALQAGEKYKFAICTRSDEWVFKTDPYARMYELRPRTAAVVVESHHHWRDQEWMATRSNARTQPLAIYEVHLGSWKAGLDYRSFAEQIGIYCHHMGFTHVELMPILEHPLDESWGYQVTGYFAPTSRYGHFDDFKALVDLLHQRGIGVILDWVPAHFPQDEFALGKFDGSALYEHQDPKEGSHPHWGTYIFNYGRNEVSNLLIASALFWLEEMHVDGLRVDAVASMLYRDYGRGAQDWVPNAYGGRENFEAIEFLRHLTSIVHERVPGSLLFAEESTAFTGVTHPLTSGGLGFDFKWNLGWMHDSLHYFQTDPLFRSHHHNDLTFGFLYAFSEQFVLPFSHDEVVHGKGSLLRRMPGDEWQRFANLRLLLSYMICQPGKKLLFMGAELGQYEEWDCKGSLRWDLLNYPIHAGLQQMVKELLHLYRAEPALWAKDGLQDGFEWIDCSDRVNGVLAYLRHGQGRTILAVHHATPAYFPSYRLCSDRLQQTSWRLLFNSDEQRFGGSGKQPYPISAWPGGLEIALPPLATLMFESIRE